MSDELTEVEQKIFNKVCDEYHKKGKIPNEKFLIKIIKLANTKGDGFKRVKVIGEEKFHLVSIEDMILYGLKASELNTKYPLIEG